MSGMSIPIQGAFEDKLKAFALANHVDASRLAWPNLAFNPNAEGDTLAGTFWLRGNLLPGRPMQGTLGTDGLNYQVGIYQVDVFWPRNEADAAAMAMADAISSYFKRGTVINSPSGTTPIQVETTNVWSGSAPDDPDWFHIPVNIGFRTWTPNV
jgi:hypothetical protein